MVRFLLGGNIGDVLLYLFNLLIEEMVRCVFFWEEGWWVFWWRWVKWLVRIGMGVEGLRGGREGVRRLYFGFVDRSVLWLVN